MRGRNIVSDARFRHENVSNRASDNLIYLKKHKLALKKLKFCYEISEKFCNFASMICRIYKKRA